MNKLRKLFSTIKKAGSAFIPFSRSPEEVVSIDMDTHSIKVVTVRKEGERAIISSFVTIDRSHEDISGDIKSFFKGENNYSGLTVIITDEAKFLASELNMPNVDKLPYDKIISAVSWEMEPYLDFPVPEGLFAYNFQARKPKADTSPVLISAMNKKTYSTFSRILKGPGLSLCHAYSPEVSFLSGFALPLRGRNKFVIECRDTSIRGVTLTPEGPSVFQDIPSISEDTTLEKAVRDLIHDLVLSVTVPKDIIIAGSRASEELVEVLKMEFEDLRLWGIQDFESAEVVPDISHDFGPQYVSAVGAALQELGIYGKEPFAVTRKVSIRRFATRVVKENEYLIPAFVVGLFFLFIASHYTTTKLAVSGIRDQIAALKKEETRLIKPVEEKKTVKGEIRVIKSRERYLKESLSVARQLLAFLDSIPDVIPSDLVLKKISQNSDGAFIIKANVFKGRSAADFCRRLSSRDFCKEAKIVKFNLDGGGQKKGFPHGIVISLKLK